MNNEKGFGLIELMVSISIMAIIMAVVLARHDRFNGVILLRSQAYEVALQMREVQLSAVSATSRAGEYRSVLGVYFDTTTPSQFVIFEDSTSGANQNNRYDPGEELGQQGILDPRFEIRAIRAVGDSISGTGVSIIFERPNFDARFYDTSLVNASSVEIDIAKVDEVGTGSDVVRTVEVTAAGQIAVQ